MKIGVSTGCFYPQKPHIALEKIGGMGIECAEIFFNTHSELLKEYLYKLKQIKDKYNINVISIHPYTSAIETFLFFSVDDYKLNDSINMYIPYFEACRILNCKYIVIHGCFDNRSYMNMERYCKNLNKLSQKAREYGVFISQENVFKYKCGYLKNLTEFVKYADSDIKFTFDIKQAVKSNQSVYKILDLTKDRISHLHLSDCINKKHSLMPLTGKFNYKRFFKYIKENTHCDFGLIEVYADGVKYDLQLKETCENLKNIINILE